jgi:AcrR family transcriptional regulator
MTDRRTALLDAAVGQIASKGTRGMRVEEVARAAGVSPALIYHHFGDRSTLLQRSLEHIGDRAEAYTARAGGTAREMLVGILVDEIQDDDTVRTNSAAWGELRDTAIFDPALRPTIAKLTRRWVSDIADLVRSGHREGTISRELDPEALGIRLSSLVEGLSARWLTGLLTTEQARGHLEAAIAAVLDAEPRRA